MAIDLTPGSAVREIAAYAVWVLLVVIVLYRYRNTDKP